jgi:hypothetical protein
LYAKSLNIYVIQYVYATVINTKMNKCAVQPIASKFFQSIFSFIL